MKNLFLLFSFLLSICVSYSQKKELSVEAIWRKFEFSEKRISGFNSMEDGIHFTKLSQVDGELVLTKHSFLDYNGKGETILSAKDLVFDGKEIAIDDYAFNVKEDKLLISSNTRPIYRRSYTTTYFVFDCKNKKLSLLDESHAQATLADFAPDGNKIAFISENNLFVKDLTTNVITQLTNDGKTNALINGTTDWVYEEEFGITKAFEWSYDSKHIAYLKFNESNVREFSFPVYGENYTKPYSYKYPKAGEENSKVTLHIYSFQSNKTEPIKLSNYEYIPRLKWSTTTNTLIIQTLNRHQNHLVFYAIKTLNNTWNAQAFFTEKSDTYVEIDDNLLLLPNEKGLIRTSEISGFNHIYKVSFDGKQTAITKGNWDVIEIYGINKTASEVFFSSAEKGAIHKGVYKIGLNGKNKISLSNEFGTNDADFSSGMEYFLLKHSTASKPTTYSLKSTLTNSEIAVLEDNNSLITKLKDYTISKKEFVTFTGKGGSLNGWIIKPVAFDSTKKYPVYVNIYGGPGHNTVSDSWGGTDFMYHQLLAQNGYFVVSVDPRGTMYRGVNHKKATYLNMGKLELEDFISTVEELGKLSYIDTNRIGIQGWSYGGFMTSLAMTKGKGKFKMGIAVAPVTNWKYYDNIYTERFMRTPQENKSGYEDNSPINYAQQLKGKYFLIHGTADDNVHFQNAMELTNALIKANIQFDQFSYPNKNHGIYGGNTRNHLFEMMFQYTLKNL
jgi:dipeptidyl-peptidase-4